MPESPRAEQRIESAQERPTQGAAQPAAAISKPMPKEVGGRGGLDPVRYGDWEKNGRCIDF